MRKNVIRINESILRQMVDESVRGILNRKGKSILKESNNCDDFYCYVVSHFNQEGIEIGDAGDAEELYQGCSNYDYETVPFDELYQKLKRDWMEYKTGQNQYQGLNEGSRRKRRQ